jgi:hypothetical protein
MPHHRNAAAPGANKNESLPQKAGAPAKAAYAVIGVSLGFQPAIRSNCPVFSNES